MNRFSLAVTAAVVSATAVTGVMAFSALGADQHLTPEQAKKLQHAREQPGVAPPELLACLRGRGLNPPTNPMELKMWIVRTPAAQACIEAAGPNEVKPGAPDDKQGPRGECGGGKPAPAPATPAPSSSQSGSAPS